MVKLLKDLCGLTDSVGVVLAVHLVLSSLLGSSIKVEEENGLHEIVLLPPDTYCGTCVLLANSNR